MALVIRCSLLARPKVYLCDSVLNFGRLEELKQFLYVADIESLPCRLAEGRSLRRVSPNRNLVLVDPRSTVVGAQSAHTVKTARSTTEMLFRIAISGKNLTRLKLD